MKVDRWLRFIVGGVVNTGITYAAYLAFRTVLSYQIAYLVAYAIGIVIAYVVNSRLVFRVPLSAKRFFAYPLVYVAQYAIAAGLLAVGVEILNVPDKIAPLLVTIAMVPVSYGINKIALRE